MRLAWSCLLAACSVAVSDLPAADLAPDATDETATPIAFEPTAEDFGCMTELAKVRRYHVGNLLGDVDASVAVAEAPEGKTYPVGTLLQLVPAEAMVKREPGFSPDTNDWEYFSLAIDRDGVVTISDRGPTGVVNAFGGDCFSCHAAAAAYDYVCETDHGCVELPLSDEAIAGIQENDPRCR